MKAFCFQRALLLLTRSLRPYYYLQWQNHYMLQNLENAKKIQFTSKKNFSWQNVSKMLFLVYSRCVGVLASYIAAAVTNYGLRFSKNAYFWQVFTW